MATGRWRFVWNTWAALGGLLAGFGLALLLQQFAVYPLALAPIILGATVGVVAGAALPSLLFVLLGQMREAEP